MRRVTTNLKRKKHPEVPPNQTVWESDNQGLKEAMFIQIVEGVEMESWGREEAVWQQQGGGSEVVVVRQQPAPG